MADDVRDPIEYLLNAMVAAGRQSDPSEHGYAEKRRAVLDAIHELRRERDGAWGSGREKDALIGTLSSALVKTEALLRDVAASGVEHDDPRMDYLTIQIDRATWNGIRATVEA